MEKLSIGKTPEECAEIAVALATDADRRCEQAGETLFCYTEVPEQVVADLEANNPKTAGLRYLHRPANLEDVFLKLTGRDLRD